MLTRPDGNWRPQPEWAPAWRPAAEGAPARRPVSRVLCRAMIGVTTVIHLGRRLPAASSGRPEGSATHLPRGRSPGCALLFGLAPGRVCPFHPGGSAKPPRPARLCGTGPRLAADGCYPLPCVVELGLSSCLSRVSPLRHATARTPRWHAHSTRQVSSASLFRTSVHNGPRGRRPGSGRRGRDSPEHRPRG